MPRTLFCLSLVLLLNAARGVSRAEVPSAAGRLPRHAIQVLGNDRYTCQAKDVVFVDPAHVVATSGGDLISFEVPSGKAQEVRTDLDKVRHGGNRWFFGTRKVDEQSSLTTIWDLHFEQARRTVKGDARRKAIAISDDGRFAAMLNSFYRDLSIDIVDVNSGEDCGHVAGPEQHTGNSADDPRVTFVRDGQVLAVEHRVQPRGRRFRFYPFAADGTIGDLISELTLSENNNSWRLETTRSRDQVLLIGNDGTVTLHNFATGKATMSVKLGVTAFDAATNRSTTLLATCGAYGLIHLWDIATQRQLVEISSGESIVYRLDYSPDDQLLVTTGSGRIRFWNTITGQEMFQRNEGSLSSLAAVAIAPDEGRVAVADRQGRAQLWDLRTRAERDLEDNPAPRVGGFDPWVGPNFLAFSPDGSMLAGGSNHAHNAVNLWDATSGRRIKKIVGHRWPIMNVAWSPDGGRIASTSRDKTLRVCDLDGKLLRTFDDASLTFRFFPDGSRIASCRSFGEATGLRIFDVRTGKVAQEIAMPDARSAPTAVAVASNGSQLVSVHVDGKLRVWSVGEGEPSREVELRSEGGVATSRQHGCVAISPDSRLFAATTGTRAIWLGELETGVVLTWLHGHRAAPTSLKFSSSGDYLVSTAADQRVIVWSVPAAVAR